MTMYYHRRNNNAYATPIGKWAIVISFMALLLFFAGQPVFRTLSSFLNPIAAPFLRFGASLDSAFNGIFPFLKTNKALIEENAALKNELAQANGKLFTYALLADENKMLKESFGRTAGESPVLAAVLAKPSHSPYDTLILDAGVREGITVGNIVSAFETVAIGTIMEVSPQTSKAVLFSAPGEKTTVQLQAAHITRDIVGQGGGMFLFTAPRDISIASGEMLTLPGINQRVVGVITDVKILPDDSFQTVTAVLPVNIFELERVFITPGRTLLKPTIDAAKKSNL